MWNDDIKFRIVQPDEYERVADFIVENFYRDEPLSSLKPKVVPSQTIRSDILDCLKDGKSILGVQVKEAGEEELAAINVAIVEDSSSTDKYFEASKLEGNTKYGHILKLLGVASREADVVNRYGIDKILHSYLSYVNPAFRDKNLGVRVKLELMDMGRRMGYKLLTAHCTSYYSARICERLDWDRVNFIAYKDYLDENSQPVFCPSPPHVGLATFAKRL